MSHVLAVGGVVIKQQFAVLKGVVPAEHLWLPLSDTVLWLNIVILHTNMSHEKAILPHLWQKSAECFLFVPVYSGVPVGTLSGSEMPQGPLSGKKVGDWMDSRLLEM